MGRYINLSGRIEVVYGYDTPKRPIQVTRKKKINNTRFYHVCCMMYKLRLLSNQAVCTSREISKVEMKSFFIASCVSYLKHLLAFFLLHYLKTVCRSKIGNIIRIWSRAVNMCEISHCQQDRVYQSCWQCVISHTYHGHSYRHAVGEMPWYSSWSMGYRNNQLQYPCLLPLTVCQLSRWVHWRK